MEKIKLLLYCTKSKPTLYNVLGKYITSNFLGKDFMQNGKKQPELNGKIVSECEFEVEKIKEVGDEFEIYCYTESLLESELLEKSCLTEGQLYGYLESETGYAIHIKNLHIFDKPKELSEYWKNGERVKNAPQNMMLVQNIYEDKVVISLKEVKAIKVEKYILISIRPEWMCLILNKEKTIEVRKKVLKGMI